MNELNELLELINSRIRAMELQRCYVLKAIRWRQIRIAAANALEDRARGKGLALDKRRNRKERPEDR